MPLLHFILELRPELEITYGAGVTEPDSEYIVDESAVEKEVLFPPWHQLVFMECIKNSCPGRGRGNSHSRPRNLPPVGISELEKVVSEDQLQCLYEVFGVCPTFCTKVGGDFRNCWFSFDVCVHRRRVTCEKERIARQSKSVQNVFQSKCVLEVRGLPGGKWL